MNPIFIITTNFIFPHLPEQLGKEKHGFIIWDSEFHTQVFDTKLSNLPKTPKILIQRIQKDSKNPMVPFIFKEAQRHQRDLIINGTKYKWEDINKSINKTSKTKTEQKSAHVIDINEVLNS